MIAVALRTILFCLLCCMPTFGSADITAGEQALKNGDYTAALNEFLPLAKQGDPKAQLNLGLMYYNGQAVPQDYQEAVKWFRGAADQGYGAAQSLLGLLYEVGLKVPQNYQEAVKWYRLGADQGNSSAQRKLASMYAHGQGVPQDYVLAHMWYSLAAAGGNVASLQDRDSLAEKMPPMQIAEAQRLAREWKPTKRR
jgi:TPR repeat protein